MPKKLTEAAQKRIAALRRPLADKVKKARDRVVKRQATLGTAVTCAYGGLQAWKFAHRADPEKELADAEATLRTLLVALESFDLSHGVTNYAATANYQRVPNAPTVAEIEAEQAREQARALAEIKARYGAPQPTTDTEELT